MPSNPIIDVAGDVELSDDAIVALASLLLDLAERGEEEAGARTVAEQALTT